MNIIVSTITTAITGILSAVGNFLTFSGGGDGESADGWTIIMALALAAGVAALGIRMVKKLGR